MKYPILLILFLCCSLVLDAQQEAHFTQFMQNKLLINPAYAGSLGVPALVGIYRNQWIGFEGAPVSQVLSLHSPMFTKKVGLGLSLTSTSIGFNQHISVSGAYSYTLVNSKNGNTFRIGFQGIYKNIGMNFSKSIGSITSPIDPAYSQNVNFNLLSFGIGLYGTIKDRFYYGLSIPHLIENTLGEEIPQSLELSPAKIYRHNYAMIGGAFPLSNSIELNPNILLKYTRNTPIDLDFNTNIVLKRKITLGVSYRMGGDGQGDSIDFLTLFQINQKMQIGFAYDATLSKLKQYSKGSLEVVLGYKIKDTQENTKDIRNLSNPRFFF